MTELTAASFPEYFSVEALTESHDVGAFMNQSTEYMDFLCHSALRYQAEQVTKTFLFVDKQNGAIAAYVSLVTDAVMIENDEKADMGISDFPYETIPAIKIAKLAVHSNYAKQYHHLGSCVIQYAISIANFCNRDYAACRVVTVDADIEYDENLPVFYAKNGFIPLQNPRYTTRTKTRPMYRDIF
jgi:hypothetical protein